MKYFYIIIVLCLIQSSYSLVNFQCITIEELNSKIAFGANSLVKSNISYILSCSSYSLAADAELKNQIEKLSEEVSTQIDFKFYCLKSDKPKGKGKGINIDDIIKQSSNKFNLSIITSSGVKSSVYDIFTDVKTVIYQILRSKHENDDKINSKQSFSLIENKEIFVNSNTSSELDFHNVSRSNRLMISFGFLILSSIILFIIVRKTVDWATNAKSELNRYRDARAKHIADSINEKFNYLKRMD